ncbi:hypothetical protein FDF26_03995 [Clostridium botulinum]|uniref:rhodanese-like domain-containing protein n=1 Tax=Clostridium cagae TaxID=2080751 RepID=UPI000CF64F63|nr:rhodanese-like domain-containing protein [Clostridium cagae]NFT06247.1 hypothetical protein [Clostridium botulinum]
MDKLDKNKIIITYCNKGVTGNTTQNIFINARYKKFYNLSGGTNFIREVNNEKNFNLGYF